MKEIICFRGDRNLWLNFTIKLKKQRKEVWKTLKPFIEQYLKEK